MTRLDRGHFSQKHPGDAVDERVAQKIRTQAPDGELPCATAFIIATHLSVELSEVGRNADLLEIPIVKCQLGLFGYGTQKKVVEPAESVAPDLEKAIREELVNGRIPCAHVFSLASRLRQPKMTIASVCEALHIKISPCQLGAF